MTPSQISFIFVIIFGTLLLLVALNIYQKITLKRQIKRQWHQIPKVTNFDKEESLKAGWEVFRQSDSKAQIIDDITWHDLDFLHVFELLNGTKSSVGSEALYRRLRTLNKSTAKQNEFQNLIDCFATDDKARQQAQYALARLGKKDKNLLWYYLMNPRKTQIGKPGVYYLLGALPLVAILGLLISQSVFFVYILLASIGINFTIYQVKKETLERELGCMSYLINSITTGESLGRVPHPLQAELIELNQTLKVIKWFGFAFRVKSGSEGEMLFEYFTAVFLLPLISYNIVLSKLVNKQAGAIRLLEIIGDLDSAMAILNFTAIMPYTSQPVFHDKLELTGVGMYHPLLQQAVANEVNWKQNTLVTGSNASGKSTYIKGVAINCLLAQTIGYTCAEKWQMKKGHVFSSMALEDNLFEGDSYFVAEIKSVNRIIEYVKQRKTTYCFIDEILRGTNTIERISASASIVKWLSQYPSLAFVATHDIELSEILKESCENIHFSERVTASDGIEFDFLVKTGPAQTRNALKLLEIMDYPSEIVAEAKARAGHFEQYRRWN